MADDSGVPSFEEELRLRSLVFEKKIAGNLAVLVVGAYPVPRGQFEGKMITLGVQFPADYPSTPPAGIHTRRAEEISTKVANPQPSDLGADWQRWSRVVQNWTTGKRRADLFLGQVDAWLEFR